MPHETGDGTNSAEEPNEAARRKKQKASPASPAEADGTVSSPAEAD